MSNQFQFHNSYVLPSQNQAVPDSWKSDQNARPVGSSMQTVVVTSLSSEQNASGHINLSLPVGPNSGIMCNPYLRFDLEINNASDGATQKNGRFAGPTKLCTSLFNRYVFSINGTQVDNIQNSDMVYDAIIGHSSSADYQRNDLAVLMGCNVNMLTVLGTVAQKTYCVPLLGALSAPSFPLYLLNGSCAIDIDLNTATRAFGPGTSDANNSFHTTTTYKVKNVQLIYDRVNPSDEFLQSVKAEQVSGKKFVVPFTSIQSYLVAQQNGQNNLNIGVNLSSLNSVVSTQVTTADLTSLSAEKLSTGVDGGISSFSNFQVSLDGRNINAVNYDVLNQPALAFCESQKALSRAWDSAVSDPVGQYIVNANAVLSTTNSLYLSRCFFAACSALRCNDRLAFSGSPCSVLNIAWTSNVADKSAHFMVLAYMQLLVDATGSIELLR